MINEIQNRLCSAIKFKDKPHIIILRDIKAKFSEALKIKDKALIEDEYNTILLRMVKQRQQSIEACGDNYKYQNLKKKEEFELSVIQEYLPDQMSNDEIKEKVVEIINILKISHNMKNIGKVMKTFNDQNKGQNGKTVSKIVRECLSI